MEEEEEPRLELESITAISMFHEKVMLSDA